MPGGHHPRGPVEHRPEVVPVPQFGLTGRQPHPHRQLQRPLCCYSCIDSRPRRGERGAHTVAGVLEQPAPVRLNRPAQHLVVRGQRRPHPIGVVLPPTGRTLNVGEQKRHHSRRSSRRISGHPRRISHRPAPTSYIGASGPVPVYTCLRRISASRRCRLFWDRHRRALTAEHQHGSAGYVALIRITFSALR